MTTGSELYVAFHYHHYHLATLSMQAVWDQRRIGEHHLPACMDACYIHVLCSDDCIGYCFFHVTGGEREAAPHRAVKGLL